MLVLQTAEGFAALPVLVRIAGKAKEEQLMGESSTFVMYQVVGKFMERHRICERTFAGIRANDRSFVTGCFAERGLRDQMNCSAIVGPTPGKNDSLAKNAARDSCEAIICQNM